MINVIIDGELIKLFLFFLPLRTGGLSTTAMVKIQLTDVNDNRPIFYPREYNVSLRESLPTSASVVAVVASDPDSGRFGTVTYRIVAGNDAGIFRIDRVTGEIFVTRPNLLSSRNQPYHRLNISAIDGGGLRTAQDAEIFISIIDSSQRPPIFDKTRYNFSIKEDAKKNTIVGSVSATSSNSGEFSIKCNIPLLISNKRSICKCFAFISILREKKKTNGKEGNKNRKS
jgi:protocadherin-16/23